jgi:AraC-like DNA-binding protein/ligand-binding sensor protein
MNRDLFASNLLKTSFSSEKVLDTFIINLSTRYDVNINLHDVVGVGSISPPLEGVFLRYQYHNNIFCNYIKKNNQCFQLCVENKEKLCAHCRKASIPYYGSCYMGIEEFVYPVVSDGRLIAIICAGQFSDNKELVKGIIRDKAKLYDFDYAYSIEAFDMAVKDIRFDVRELIGDISLLAQLIELTFRDSLRGNSIVRNVDLSQTLNAHQNNFIINNTKKFINENYDKELTLKLLASNSYCNYTYLSYLFKDKMNLGVIDYINNIRIQKSKELLDITSKSITEISLKVGFNDSSYFTRVFKSITGLSPKEYRERSTQK